MHFVDVFWRPHVGDGVHDVKVLGQVWRTDVEGIEAVEGTTSHSI